MAEDATANVGQSPEEELTAKDAGQTDLVLADCPNGWRSLTYVHYPGHVVNEDRAITTLGGMAGIAQAHYDKNTRIELRYRPDEPFCKPTFSKHKKVTSLALKVKRRKIPPHQEGGNEGGQASAPSYKYTVEVLGLIERCFVFEGLLDFQVLPPGLNSFGHKGHSVDLDHMQLTQLLDESYLTKDLPLFLPPAMFSKFDKPSRIIQKPELKTTSRERELVVDTTRLKRAAITLYVPFLPKGSNVPTEPLPQAPVIDHPKLQLLKQLFEERPVWSRMAVEARVKFRAGVLKAKLLPLVAYYFSNGPWKTLWVKFGYDPRVDPAAKIYQCLDVRVPSSLDKHIIAPARQDRIHRLPYSGSSEDGKFMMYTDEESLRVAEEQFEEGNTLDTDNTDYIFKPGQLPVQRQMYYQLCDLHSDDLQEIIHRNDGQERECTESSGWCEEGAIEKLRKLLITKIKATAADIAQRQDTQLPS